MNICVVGTGYAGLVTGACFADFGINVTCVDKDRGKIKTLCKGEIPFFEPGLKEIVTKNLKQDRLSFTTDLADAIRKSLVVFIAVGTPPKEDGSVDLSYIEEVARAVAKNLNGYKVVVTKSTVPVGTGSLIRKIISEGNAEEAMFDVASNPEFLREGSAVEDFMRPNRVILGVTSPQAAAILKDLYSPLYLIETPFVITELETAELIKYASNAFLAVKRIGPKFLHPGPGFGGSCLPKDTLALKKIARDGGYEFKIVEAVLEVNSRQRRLMVEKIKNALGGLSGKVIGVLGLTFKPNTDDIRESPAIDIVRALISEGALIRAYDPVGMENAKKVLPKGVTYCEDSYGAAEGSDALVLLTEWNQFRKLDMERIKGLLKSPRLIDMRNVYEPSVMKKLGIEYISVGR
jgi:UDPglucose 6-dehydrogenase